LSNGLASCRNWLRRGRSRGKGTTKDDRKKKRRDVEENGKEEDEEGIAGEREGRALGLKGQVPKRARGNPLAQILIINVIKITKLTRQEGP
jgi:hypothetical protein